jgi:hypothetical protein
MEINSVRDLLNDRRVMEEIHKHLWIESQKTGYSIGLDRAVDEWLGLHGEGWMRYNEPQAYEKYLRRKDRKRTEQRSAKKAKNYKK